MLSEPIEVTLQVTRVFDNLNIPYLVGGSLASAVYGVMRATMDVDIVADIHLDQAADLASSLEKAFYVDLEMIREAIRRKSTFNLIHLETTFKVDVFVMKERPFDRNQMQRRSLQQIGETQAEAMFVSSVEDIILAKLEWFREGDESSDRQWSDILGVLKVQSDTINHTDLRKWASNLGVGDLLERAIREAELN